MNEIGYRLLNNSDLKNLLKIIEITCSKTINTYFFVPPDENYLKYILDGNGMSIGAFCFGKLVAFSSFISAENAKTDLSVFQKETNRKKNIVQYEHGVVLPEYQDKKIMSNLLVQACNYWLLKKYQYIISTVHPQNIASLKSSFKINQHAICYSELYGGYPRLVMLGIIDPDYYYSYTDIYQVPYSEFLSLKSFFDLGYVLFNFDNSSKKYILGKCYDSR